MNLHAFLTSFQATLAGALLPALGVATVAGVIASAVCPCTLPVGLGVAGASGTAESESRRSGIWIAACFFAGIVVNLTLLGAVAGRLGALATESFGRWWALVMAIVSLLAALAAFWGPRLRVDRLAALRRPGLAGAFSYGFIFSLGTSVAPLLLVLTIAAARAQPGHGLALAFAFGVGRGLPFLLVGVFAGAVIGLTRLGAWRKVIHIVTGCALLFVSAYYIQAFTALL